MYAGGFTGLFLLALLANLHAAPVVPDTSAWSAVFWNLTGIWTSEIREPEEYFPADEGFIDMRPTKPTNTAVKPATRKLLGLEQRNPKDEITTIRRPAVGNSILQKIKKLLSTLSDSHLFKVHDSKKINSTPSVNRRVRRSATKSSKNVGNPPQTNKGQEKSIANMRSGIGNSPQTSKAPEKMQSRSNKIQVSIPTITNGNNIGSHVKIKRHTSKNSNEKSSESGESKEVLPTSKKTKKNHITSQFPQSTTPKITTTPFHGTTIGKQEPSTNKPIQPITTSEHPTTVTTKMTTTNQTPTTKTDHKSSIKPKDKPPKPTKKPCKDPDDPEGSGDGSDECSGSEESTEVVPMKILHDSE